MAILANKRCHATWSFFINKNGSVFKVIKISEKKTTFIAKEK